MNYRSVADMNELILRNLDQIPADVDLVVGVPRSGLLAATLISLYLNRPLTDVQGLGENRLLGKGKRAIPGYDEASIQDARKILVVDDCISRGTEIRRTKQIIDRLGFANRTVYLAVFSFPENPHLADFTLQVVPRPMCFQWSFMHTPELKGYCLDIDGLLCREAGLEQDDGGIDDEDFLSDATPLFLPTAEVGWLVTSRLEKHREATEAWLARHRVRYRELVMLDVPSHEILNEALHVDFKASAYRRSGASLLIENSPVLAQRIAAKTGLPVMCMTSNRMIANQDVERWVGRINHFKKLLRRLRRAPRSLFNRLRPHQRTIS